MKRTLALTGLTFGLFALGCSGGGNPMSTLASDNPTLQALRDSITGASGERAEGKRGWKHHGKRGMRLLDDPCAATTGSPKEGGNAVFTNCTVPGGTLNGTITWTPLQTAGPEGSFASTTTKQLTFVRNSDAPAMLPELGYLRGLAGEDSLRLPEQWDRAEIASNISVRGVKGEWGSMTRTGTTTVHLYDGDAQVSTVALTWDAPSTLTIAVDGQQRVVDLAEIHAKMKERWGERGEGKRKFRKHGKKSGEAEGAVLDSGFDGTV